MKEQEILNLKEMGFSGFMSVSELRLRPFMIPQQKGVYIVLRKMSESIPEFMAIGTGPLYHGGKQLNYETSFLKMKWIEDTSIVYIGKSDQSLSTRIRTYLRYGEGKDAPHRGGRAIWQLPDAENLVFAWKTISCAESAASVETMLINEFKAMHDFRLPFANMRD